VTRLDDEGVAGILRTIGFDLGAEPAQIAADRTVITPAAFIVDRERKRRTWNLRIERRLFIVGQDGQGVSRGDMEIPPTGVQAGDPFQQNNGKNRQQSDNLFNDMERSHLIDCMGIFRRRGFSCNGSATISR
jgi:hypothetical protein